MKDFSTFGYGLARPGMDTRNWVSYATVNPDTANARSVMFKNEQGLPFPEGPLVNVTLWPSGVTCLCRVAGCIAGNGEAEWFPYVGGDEVLVVLPEGSERSPPVIIGRLNQSIDVWPTSVAGLDPTKNNFAFLRTRAPYVMEVGPSLIIRSAQTGCALTFGPDGSVLLANGDKHLFAMMADAITLQTTNAEALLQLNPGDKSAALQGGAATFNLNETQAKFITPGQLLVSTGSVNPQYHVTTAESVANIVQQVIALLVAGAQTPTPPVGTAGDALATALLAIKMAVPSKTASVISAAAGASVDSGVQSAINGGLSKSPGVGCANFLVG
jgi:hypothetical protein